MLDKDFESRLQRIKDDRVHGSSEVAREALRLVAECARGYTGDDVDHLVRLLRHRAAALAAARPSMAALCNLMARWSAALDNLPQDPAIAACRAAEAADELAQASRTAARDAAARLAATIRPGAAVMTHSLSSTVIELFRILRGKHVNAIVTESRPLFEGHALAAKLAELAIPTTLITDAQMGLAVRGAHVVVVGADSILADGAIVNKAGTLLLALASREAKVPFFVCAESFKRCPPGMPSPPLERMDPGELNAPDLPHVTVVNAYFDVTPAPLLSGCFTEHSGKD